MSPEIWSLVGIPKSIDRAARWKAFESQEEIADAKNTIRGKLKVTA
jgi:hypothetical protein